MQLLPLPHSQAPDVAGTPLLPPPTVSPGVAVGGGGRPAGLGSPELGDAMSATWGQACLPCCQETGAWGRVGRTLHLKGPY